VESGRSVMQADRQIQAIGSGLELSVFFYIL